MLAELTALTTQDGRQLEDGSLQGSMVIFLLLRR